MVPNLDDRETEERDLQPEKAKFKIEVTELGIIIEHNEEQKQKACSPIETTELGIRISCNEEH